MNTHAHTPGPWKLVEGNTYFQKLGQLLTTWPIYSQEGNIIAVAIQHDGENYSTATQFQDDARLIAAAPEMLDMLHRAKAALYNVPEVGHKYDQQHSHTHAQACLDIEQLITRATGRERGV